MIIINGKSYDISKIVTNFILIWGIIIIILNLFYFFRFKINFFNNTTYVGCLLLCLSYILNLKN